MRDAGCGMLDAGYWMRDAGCGMGDRGRRRGREGEGRRVESLGWAEPANALEQSKELCSHEKAQNSQEEAYGFVPLAPFCGHGFS